VAERVHQDLGMAVGIDPIQGVQLRPKTPGPPAFAVATMARLIHIQDRLVRQRTQQFLLNAPREIVTCTTSRRKVRIVENDA
jgi:hypothetical protein